MLLEREISLIFIEITLIQQISFRFNVILHEKRGFPKEFNQPLPF